MTKKTDSLADDLRREDLPPCRYYLSTGSTLLDLAISGRYPGGVGSGRVTQIYGDTSTAKTLLLQEILGSAQRLGGTAVFEDAEHTLDFHRAENLFGLHVGAWVDDSVQAEMSSGPLVDAAKVDPKFVYRTPVSIEQLYDDEIGGMLELIKGEHVLSPVAMGVDSLSALPSIKEIDSRLDDGTYGTSRAKMFSQAFRKYVHPMAELNLTVVGIDQTRENIGVAFGDKTTTSGGKAMGFYASTRVLLKHTDYIKNKHKQVVGVKIRFTIKKNKIAPPFRNGFIHILFDYGIDDVTANLEWLKDNPIEGCPLNVKGAWWNWGDKRMGQGPDAAVKFVEDEGMEKAVEQEVARVWDIVHETPDRKPRER